MEYKDTINHCKDCRSEYTITAGEQQFFTDKGLTIPKRCQSCRDKKRAEREERERQQNGGEISNEGLRRTRDAMGG